MYKKLIVFLIRKRLGLKKFEAFRFTNQHNKSESYYFTDTALIKRFTSFSHLEPDLAHVSLNWLLDDECEIERV